jgi:hypothetical protein
LVSTDALLLKDLDLIPRQLKLSKPFRYRTKLKAGSLLMELIKWSQKKSCVIAVAQ